MEPKQVDGNLKISVRRTENGEIVRHTIPRNMIYEDWEQMTPVTLTHSFERGRDPDCKSDDWHRCLHYHLGYIIDEITHDILGDEGNHGYDIEIVIKRKK